MTEHTHPDPAQLTIGCDACITIARAGQQRRTDIYGRPARLDKHGRDAAGHSYTQRLTLRRRALLDAGRHPNTGGPAHPELGTCGTCAQLFTMGDTAGRYLKCNLNATRGPATDIRASWPACHRYEPAHLDPEPHPDPEISQVDLRPHPPTDPTSDPEISQVDLRPHLDPEPHPDPEISQVDLRPASHLIATPAAEHTRCGLRRRSDEPRYPIVLAAHAPAHQANYGMVVCPACAEATDVPLSPPAPDAPTR